MAFILNFTIAADPKATIARILMEAGKSGVQFTGDDQQGTFRGHKAEGSFCVNGHQLQITITHKPLLIPEALIRKMVVAKAPEWGLAVV